MGAGEMGAALARCLADAGHRCLAVPHGRSLETRDRMEEAGMVPVPDLAALIATADCLFSVLPPSAADEEAGRVVEAVREQDRRLVFVEANAIAPGRIRRIAEKFAPGPARLVDAGIVGAPPSRSSRPRLYVSGPEAECLSELDGPAFDLRLLGPDIGTASAFKMVYAALTKGNNTLLTAVLLAGEAAGLSDALVRELSSSQAQLLAKAETNVPRLPADAGRWIFEMQEIADTFGSLGLPTGFHQAAAEIMTLLAGSEFGSETRRTRDRNRTAAETIRTLARNLPGETGKPSSRST